jgi:membrane-bound lytic murein transglycosylase B
MPFLAHGDSLADQQAALQKQLDDINKQIAQNQSELAQKQTERVSLERDVAVLDHQISEAQLEIKQRDLTIQKIKAGIAEKASGIASLDSDVAKGEASVAQILRQTNSIDNTPLAARILGDSVHDYFREIDDFASIDRALDTAFMQMAASRADLSARKAALEDQQQEESDLLQLQTAQKNDLNQKEQQKKQLVNSAKGQEVAYQNVIAGQQQTAAQIQAKLFALRDGSKQVSFGDMYAYAKEASSKTGVRPAVILAILSEETNLGQNIGSCSYHEAMHPTRDVPVFLQLMRQLGLNPEAQKVSCKPSYGWGGAMGPAQFIPSTWVLYQDRVGSITGQKPPNPYDPRTATFATALLMADNGADAGSAAAERLAALRYFAGWKNASNPAYAFYGNDVMSLAAKFQNDINVVGSGS